MPVLVSADQDEDPGDGEGLDEADMHSDPSDGEGLDEADMHADPNLGEPPISLAVRSPGTTQLTLSYQGEVYVFDTVPPEKVRSWCSASLPLLGCDFICSMSKIFEI